MSDDHVWVVVGAIFAGGLLVLYVAKEIIPQVYRHFRLKRPCKASFVITSDDRAKIDYAIQDDKEHLVGRIIVPANRDLYVQLLLKAKTAFTQRHIVFGFDPEPERRVPQIDHYKLQFVKVGNSEKFPGRDEGHWIDHHDFYHITEERYRGARQAFTYGFIIKTRDPGDYKLKIEIGVEDKHVTYLMDFAVSDAHREKMRCTEHFGCWVSPTPVVTTAA
jgi:hypothetical protein